MLVCHLANYCKNPLSNDTLRNFISSWEGQFKRIQLAEQDLLKGQDGLTKFNIEYGNVHKTGYYESGGNIPKSRFEKGNLPLLEMPAFEGLISKVCGNSKGLSTRYYPFTMEVIKEIYQSR